MKRALITGLFGQDGSYLAELLHDDNYEVHGIVRNNLSENSKRNKAELEQLGIKPIVHTMDICNYEQLTKLIGEILPDEVYHLAAIHMSSQDSEYDTERYILQRNISATYNLLDICNRIASETRILLAGSCLMFDGSDCEIQNEETPFLSESIYGIAKITENMISKKYRGGGLYVSNAILYNHESHRRGDNFVTKKIVNNLRKIKKGQIYKFTLGDISIKKDWGFAKDYVLGMKMMLENNEPKDYIIASNTLHSIKEFADECARQLGVSNWQRHVLFDQNIISRKVKCQLRGDNSRIRQELGWKNSLSFEQLVAEMIGV